MAHPIFRKLGNGWIFVNGRPNTDPQSLRTIEYIPEIPSFYPNLTVMEHMEFVARVYRMKDYEKRAEDLLEQFSMAEHRRKLGSTHSQRHTDKKESS